jgi:hypothetical protein
MRKGEERGECEIYGKGVEYGREREKKEGKV